MNQDIIIQTISVDESIVQEKLEYEIEQSNHKIATRKRRPVYSQTISVKQYHKIPLKAQQQLFDQVFLHGKRIKQVAKELKMNYSSAKSLIHYYKTQKRPAPDSIKTVLKGRKQATYSQLTEKIKNNDRLKIEIKMNKMLLGQYQFFQRMESEYNNIPS